MENYRKGASCFIIQNNSILLTERRTEPLIGYWEVPSGKQEVGENVEQTIKREVKEETNLDVEIIEEIGININDEYKFESHMFLAHIVGGELVNTEPHAHSKIEFFDLNNLPEKLGSSTLEGLRIISQKSHNI